MRYSSNMGSYGRSRSLARTFGATANRGAVVVPVAPRPVIPGTWPKIPAPPNGAIGGALIVLGGAIIYKVIERMYPSELTPNADGDPRYFFWTGWHTSKPQISQLPAEAPCHPPTTYKVAWCSASSYQKYLGLYKDTTLCSDTGTSRRGGLHKVIQRYPCPTDPGSQFDKERPRIGPPGTFGDPRTGPASRPDSKADPRTWPVPGNPGRNPGRANDISLLVTPTSTHVVSPMFPAREGKAWGSAKMVEYINAFFGAGGELIDMARCMLYATGNTYIDRTGHERAIPRSQWGEVFSRDAYRLLGNKSSTVDGSVPMSDEFMPSSSLQPTDAAGNPLSPSQMGNRLASCMFNNFLEDTIIGATGKASRQMTADLNAFLGPLGVDSQIAMLNGDPAYAGLLGSYFNR